MEKDEHKTKVIFRKFKDDRKEVIAIFPELPGTYDQGTCLAYVHCGQHCHVSIAISSWTIPAKPEDYQALKKELEQIGYNLDIRKKFTQKDHEKRRKELEFYRQKPKKPITEKH